ncbi:MAG: SoxR reducing system RseC family protein [Gammaproteobacteria bacterium]|nr:SoxR reducing system RseC family protein [Gammaproteobacteria bacterium]
MAQFPNPQTPFSGNIPDDILVRSARIIECSAVHEGLEFRLRPTSGCSGCSGSCGWRRLDILHTQANRTSEQTGKSHHSYHRNVAADVMLLVSRRGLSLASGLVFGIPLVALTAAALLFESRLGETSASALSLAVFTLCLWLIWVLARGQVLRFDTWLRFEMTEFPNDLDNLILREGNE